MKAVLDTNVVLSGLLFAGKPQLLLQEARNGILTLFTSHALLTELAEVLARPKFARRLALLQTTSSGALLAYLAIASLIAVSHVERVVLGDSDDDEVIACAFAANAECIITGDDHLLKIREYRKIQMITVSEALERLHGQLLDGE